MTTGKMEIHEAALIFPLDEENIESLAEDIRLHGLEPIQLLEGKILDGRRRQAACQKAGIVPTYIDVETDDAVAYVVSLNLHRRHLSTRELGLCAGRAKELQEKLAGEAKKRERLSKGRGVKVCSTDHTLNSTGKTRDKLGAAFGISGRTAERGKNIIQKGTPELIDAVQEGRIGLHNGEKIAKLPKSQQPAAVQAAIVHKANGRPKPARVPIDYPPHDPATCKIKGVGVFRANEAVDCLKRIPKNDALRKRGFQIVTDFIRHNP